MFHQDLLTDILLRLPAKSLLRFKCVSKHWLSLISSPQFRRRRLRLASSGIILCQTTDLIHHTSVAGSHSDPPFTSLSFIGDSAGMKILQSSYGLLLCCSSLHKRGKRRSYYICNPSTQQFSTLPEADCENISKTIYGVYLTFDSSKLPDHYQVASVRSCSSPSSPSSNSFQIVTYSSKTRAWRISGSPFIAPDMVFDNGVLWNGSIHWISPTGDSFRFDTDQERLGTMPSLQSNEKWSNKRLRYFGESGGHLHLIEIYGSATQFYVFEMERDYSSWVPKYHVDIAAIIDAFPVMIRNYPDATDSVFYAFSLLFVKEDEEDSFLLLHVPGEFLLYNLRNGTFKKLGPISTEANVAFQIGCFHAYQFRETLADV
ncbi:F-box protein At5g07610-like [Argentina anserina]|uniref:F-box protein At5g07610-like n=1 Tax=Argentina anserina TaxID=57926 RepID=UPI00217667FE|nr:F-box protein At5g07610-like [Potentilla anserina]